MKFAIVLRYGGYKKEYPAIEAEGMREALEIAKARFPLQQYKWDSIGVRDVTEREE